MKKFLLLLLAVLVLTLGVCLEPTRVVWGGLRGEAFYQGRPTSFYAGAIDRFFGTLTGPTSLLDHCRKFFGVTVQDEANVLSRDSAAIPVLLELLDDERPVVRSYAIGTLIEADWWMEEHGDQALRQALAHPRAEVRWDVANSIARHQYQDKTQAALVLPVLLEALRDGPAWMKPKFVFGLGSLGPSAKAALPVLQDLQGDADLKAAAVRAIDVEEMP